jgi:hypothetical protein
MQYFILQKFRFISLGAIIHECYDTQHKDRLCNADPCHGVWRISYCYAKCQNASCRSADCRGAITRMQMILTNRRLSNQIIISFHLGDHNLQIKQT